MGVIYLHKVAESVQLITVIKFIIQNHMIKNLLSFSAILMLSMAFVSCKKQEGCTDKNASNYSVDAEEDDGTCTYKGSVVFWYNQATSNYLTSDPPSQSLVFYVDGTVVGSTAANVYWNSAPSCGANGSITVEKDLGFSKSRAYNYSIVDNNNLELWSGSVTMDANTCLAFQLN
jgi:hypothetical protein